MSAPASDPTLPACKKYLRFDHPISTILATQLIVALTMLLVMLNFG